MAQSLWIYENIFVPNFYSNFLQLPLLTFKNKIMIVRSSFVFFFFSKPSSAFTTKRRIFWACSPLFALPLKYYRLKILGFYHAHRDTSARDFLFVLSYGLLKCYLEQNSKLRLTKLYLFHCRIKVMGWSVWSQTSARPLRAIAVLQRLQIFQIIIIHRETQQLPPHVNVRCMLSSITTATCWKHVWVLDLLEPEALLTRDIWVSVGDR